MKLTINGIRGITWEFNFKDLNILSWKNGAGKSTVLEIISNMLVNKTSIKTWTAILDIDWKITTLINWVINNSPQISIKEMWFLSWKGKQVKGLNSTKEDKRNTIFNLLWIEKFPGDIKWLTWELRDLKVQETTLMDEMVEKESFWEMTMDKPKIVILKAWTKSNQIDIDRIQNEYKAIEKEEIPESLPNPDEVKFIEKITIKGNNDELIKLQDELEKIKNEWLNKKSEIENVELENIQEKCPTCQRDYDDTNQAKIIAQTTYDDLTTRLTSEKELISRKYLSQLETIASFKLIPDAVKESNIKEYDIYRDVLELHNKRSIEISNTESRNEIKERKITELNKQIKDFVLIEATEWNEDEYEKYQLELSNYNANEIVNKSRSDDIINLKKKIKDIPTVELESKIKKFRKDELAFVESIEDKLTINDIKISVFSKLRTPNAVWDMYKSDFTISYKWKEYSTLSSWEQIICDIVIHKMFMSDSWTNLVMVDSAEISTENLKTVISELEWLTVITSRISTTALTLKHTL